MTDENIAETIEEVARITGKSVRTVYRWVRAGLPTLPDGRFDLTAVNAWRRRKQGIITSGQGGVAGPETEASATASGKDFWDKEGKQYQALLRKLEYEKRVGELIERKDVEDLFITRIQAVKQALLSLERSLPPELIACRSEREMMAAIHKTVRGMLEAFSRPLPESMRPTVEEETHEPA